MTADQYLALGETPERYELVDGVVVMSPSPDLPHQDFGVLLVEQLLPAVRRLGGKLVYETDIRFSPTVVYRPDVVCYGAGRVPSTAKRLSVARDLVVEILSPGNKSMDLITKREDYERYGVGEYWVVDPETGDVRGWRRGQGGRFEDVVATNDRLPSSVLPGFTLDLAPLRRAASHK